MQTAEVKEIKKPIAEGFWPIDWIFPNPLNPRKKFDQAKLEELAQSIQEVGVLQPLVVTLDSSSQPEKPRYRIIAGERRWRAAKLAGLEKISITVVTVTEKQEAQIMMIENLQREDLDPIDEARAFQSLTRDHGWKQQDLAKELGVSQAHIANRIRLLKLPEEIQDNISAGIIPHSVGKELVTYAKVPGVTKEIQKQVDKASKTDAELNPQEILSNAKNSAWNNTKPLHKEDAWPAPEFDLIRPCEQCDRRVTLPKPYGGEKRYPRCLDKDCWEERQEEASREKQSQAIEQAAQVSGVDKEKIIVLKGYGEYRYMRENISLECETCENRKIGVMGYRVEPETICTKPDCFDEKQKSKYEEASRERQKEGIVFEEWKDQLISQEGTVRETLHFMSALAVENMVIESSDDEIESLCDHFGWDHFFEDVGCIAEEEAREIVKRLGGLSEHDLWWVIRFCLIKPISVHSDVYQVMFGEGEKEKECSCNGDCEGGCNCAENPEEASA